MNTELQAFPQEQQQMQTHEHRQPYHRAVDEQLSRLAVHHAIDRYNLNRLPIKEALDIEEQTEGVRQIDRELVGNSAYDRVFRQHVGHENVPEFIKNGVDSDEKSRTLETVGATIRRQAAEHHVSEDAEVPWRAVSHSLVEAAKSMEEGEERDAHLVGAVLAAQFSTDPEDRLALLEDVYDKDLETAARDACYRSHIVLSLGKDENGLIETYSMRGFVPAFDASKETFDDYIEYTRKELHKEELPSAKKVQKQLTAEGPGEASPETLTVAQEVGQATEKARSYLIDLYKLERFALQEEFIKKQMPEVLGSDLAHTPLAAQLAARRKNPSELIGAWDFGPQSTVITEKMVVRQAAIQLASDIRASFTELSQPIVEAFSLKDSDGENIPAGPVLKSIDQIDRAALTPEQRAGLRFHQVTKALKEQMEVSKFVDIRDFLRRRESEQAVVLFDETSDISTISEDGAGVSDGITTAIERTMSSVLDQEESDDQTQNLGDVSPDELRDFARRNRRTLLAVATHNIAELPDPEVLFREGLRRNEQGDIVFSHPPGIVAKDSLDVYAAITLGCPALRLQHPSRAILSMQERAALGSSNFIDHALAVAINEAYERGMFNKDYYRSLLSSANQKRDQIQSDAAQKIIDSYRPTP